MENQEVKPGDIVNVYTIQPSGVSSGPTFGEKLYTEKYHRYGAKKQRAVVVNRVTHMLDRDIRQDDESDPDGVDQRTFKTISGLTVEAKNLNHLDKVASRVTPVDYEAWNCAVLDDNDNIIIDDLLVIFGF